MIPLIESVFKKIAGMNSRPTFLLKRSFQQGKPLKRCHTINLLKNVILRKLVFGTFSEMAGHLIEINSMFRPFVENF